MKKEHSDNLADLNDLNDLDYFGPYSHVETIRLSRLSYWVMAKNLIRSLFDNEQDKLTYIESGGGYVALSYACPNGDHRFEIYRLKGRESRKDRGNSGDKGGRESKEPEFIRNIRKLPELYNMSPRRIKNLVESHERKLEKRKRLEKPEPVFEYGKLKELCGERPDSSSEQRLSEWYKRVLLKMARKAIEFRGYEEDEWNRIKRMLPTPHQISREKMEKWGDENIEMLYWTLLNEVWSDKPYPDPALYGAEVASHFLEALKDLNQGCRAKNPLQKEAIEWIEEMTRSYLDDLTSKKPTRTSLSKEEIEKNKKIKMRMRVIDEDPHVGYYLAKEGLVEKLKNMSSSERREFLSCEGYKNLVLEDAKETLEERVSMLLHMYNVIVRTRGVDGQKRNLAIVKALLTS